MRIVRIKNVQYFYILHSSTQVIERVPMCKEFDITSKVTEGKKYAGYGSEYVKKGAMQRCFSVVVGQRL